MISALFTAITSVVTGFMTVLTGGYEGAVALVWDGTAITDFGTLALLAVGVSLVYFVIRSVFGLVRLK